MPTYYVFNPTASSPSPVEKGHRQGHRPRPAARTSLLDPVKALGHGGLASAAVSAFFSNYAFFTVPAFTPFVLNMSPYRSGAVFFAWGVLLAVFSLLVAPRLQARLGSLKVPGGCLVLLAADLVVLGYGSHTTAIVCTIASGALIGLNNTVWTEIALGVSDAPRPVATAGYNVVRWFAAAAAPTSRRRPGVDGHPHPVSSSRRWSRRPARASSRDAACT